MSCKDMLLPVLFSAVRSERIRYQTCTGCERYDHGDRYSRTSRTNTYSHVPSDAESLNDGNDDMRMIKYYLTNDNEHHFATTSKTIE